MAALNFKVAVCYADGTGISPCFTGVFMGTGGNGQGACTRSSALNFQVAHSFQSGYYHMLIISTIFCYRSIAAGNCVRCAVSQHNGGSVRQLNSRGSLGGEVDAPECQSLGAVIPSGIGSTEGLILIEQSNRRRTAVGSGEVRRFCCRVCGKRRHRHQRQHHAQRQQDCQQLCLNRFILHSLSFLSYSFSPHSEQKALSGFTTAPHLGHFLPSFVPQ